MIAPLSCEWVRLPFDAVDLSVEDSEIMIEEADDPDVVIDFLDSDELT